MKKNILLISPPNHLSSFSMKTYAGHIYNSCCDDFELSFYDWSKVLKMHNSFIFRFYKYVVSRINLYRAPPPYIQHITDQSYAHLFNKKARYNFLTVHDINPIILYKKNKRLIKIPPIMFYYTTFFYKKFNKIITPSIYTKKLLIDHIGVDEKKIIVVYNAVELKESKKQKTDYLSILLIGDTYTKNIKKSIEAINSVVKQRDLKAKINWVSNKNKEEINRMIGKLSFNIKLNIHRNISESMMMDLYATNSFLLFPSIVEGFGYPIIEAMRNKTRVITSNIGATKEISKNFCITVNPNSIKDIINGINILLDEDMLLAQEKLDEAYEYSLRFNIQQFKKSILEIYNSHKESQ